MSFKFLPEQVAFIPNYEV